MNIIDGNERIAEITEQKAKIRQLEQFYVDGTMENLNLIVEAKKNRLVEEIIKYKEENKEVKFTKDGYPINVLNLNPYVISSFFFKSLNPMACVEPKYSAEQLGILFQLYDFLVGEVNKEIGIFSPSIPHFCKFIGITTNTIRVYRNSPDNDVRTVISKIYDLCQDTSLTMAQGGYIKERTTVYRAKAELGLVEKQEPNINITIKENIDLAEINKRIEQLSNLNTKKLNSGDK